MGDDKRANQMIYQNIKLLKEAEKLPSVGEPQFHHLADLVKSRHLQAPQ
jgi:hypothetical protein